MIGPGVCGTIAKESRCKDLPPWTTPVPRASGCCFLWTLTGLDDEMIDVCELPEARI